MFRSLDLQQRDNLLDGARKAGEVTLGERANVDSVLEVGQGSDEAIDVAAGQTTQGFGQGPLQGAGEAAELALGEAGNSARDSTGGTTGSRGGS
jgi:hypothetical protein